jgi:hypothetical protein
MACLSLEQCSRPVVIGRVEEKAEWRFKPLGNFMFVRLKRESRRNDANDRSDHVAGDRPIWLKRARDIDPARIDSDLLISFAERSFDRGFTTVHSAAWEGNLAGMGPQMLATDGEDHAWFTAVGNRNEHGGLNSSVAPELGKIANERRIDRSRRE